MKFTFSLVTSTALLLFDLPVSHAFTSVSFKSWRTPTTTSPRTTSTSSLKAFDVSAELSGLDALYQNAPYLASFITCSVKASAADFLAQSKQPTPQAQQSLDASVTKKDDEEEEKSRLDVDDGFSLYRK